MRYAALISNGPSACLYGKCKGRYSLVIGVNRAVAKYCCDWWTACDWETLRDVTPLGEPFLFTKRVMPQTWRELEPQTAGKYGTFKNVLFQEDTTIPWPYKDMTWNCFSGCAALALVYRLCPQHVDVYGADMAGSTDLAGTDKPELRCEGRWEKERIVWRRLVQILDRKNIAVNRIA